MVAGISDLVKENTNAGITQDMGSHMFRFRWIDLEAKYSIFIWFTHPPVIPLYPYGYKNPQLFLIFLWFTNHPIITLLEHYFC